MVHANGGTFTSGNNTGQAGDYMVTVQDGGSLVSALPQVQRDGYLFAGWSYDKDGKSPVVATDFVSANTEVYAQWTKQKPVVDAKQFNVTVSTNGAPSPTATIRAKPEISRYLQHRTAYW